MKKTISSCFMAMAVLFFVESSHATPILGGSVFVDQTGIIDAVFLGQTADYSNDLYLYLWDAATNDFVPDNAIGLIFNNHSSPVGSEKNLGTFTSGEELVFGIYVNNTGNEFFTGDGSRNPDGIAHVYVDEDFSYNGQSATYVGFEDLLGGGDRDYDDLMFAFTNTKTSVPEPSMLCLLGIGLLSLCMRRKRS